MNVRSREETFHLFPENASLDGVRLNEKSEGILSPNCDRGICIWEISGKSEMRIGAIMPEKSIEPAREFLPPADIILQIRWINDDGTWSSWFPENLLAGGDFRDDNHSGLPDLADILEITTHTLIYSDRSNLDKPRWAKDVVSHAAPPLLETIKGEKVLVVHKQEETGQTIVQMRSDRIPSFPAITISGWNGWNLGERYTMGLMSRFHEIDAEGNRLDKIMFTGDDDFHQRGGIAPLKWRAVSFSPRSETRRLNLYPMRLIGSPGTIMASRYQIRADSLSDPLFRGASISCPDIRNHAEWITDAPELVELLPNGIALRPLPLSNAFLLCSSFEIPDAERIALSIEMEVEVPERYNDRDPSHKAWMSTYLEFLDDKERVMDVLQITACRPLRGDKLMTAGEKPQGSRRARIRLVASHKTYLGRGDEKNMDGVMICWWRNLEMFECLYPQTYRARLDEAPFKSGEIPSSQKYQIRAILLSDRKTPSPVLKSVKYTIKK
ncbi:hypothetical protein JW926_09365 [Candidatus Sumerlaeota bacterium]|nr:hypothetical protein [Candidatus Sumerlaeota bacterium]